MRGAGAEIEHPPVAVVGHRAEHLGVGLVCLVGLGPEAVGILVAAIAGGVQDFGLGRRPAGGFGFFDRGEVAGGQRRACGQQWVIGTG